MGLIREFIGANCKDKKERKMRYSCHLNEGETMASLWHSLANEHHEIEAIANDLRKTLNLPGSQFFRLSIWRTGH